jgi:hypothetical protein
MFTSEGLCSRDADAYGQEKRSLIYNSDIQKNAKFPDTFINRSTKWREHPLSSPNQWYMKIAEILSVLQHLNDNALLHQTPVPSPITKSKL